MRTSRRIVVVGAGMAGLRAAEQLRAQGWTEDIVVLGDEPHLPYNRPPLSKEALAGMGGAEDVSVWADKLAFRRRGSVADVSWRLGDPVLGAALDARTVTTAHGTVGYDGLVVASGLRPRRLAVAGPHGGRFPLRTLDDAARLRAELRPGVRVVVVGGGFIGCEVAATALGLGCRVSVVEPLEVCLLRGLGPDVGRWVQDHLSAHGVRVLTGRGVRRLEGSVADPGRVAAVVLDDGQRLAADVVVEAVGSDPNVEWLTGNGLDLDDGVLTGPDLAVAGWPEVVAVGDVARFANPRFDHVPRRVEHWCIPTDTAKHATGTLVRALGPSAGSSAGECQARPGFAPLPSFWSDLLDLRIQSFGAPGLADRLELVTGRPGDLAAGLVAHYLRGGALVAAVLVNVGGPEIRRQRELVSAACPA